MKRYASIWLMDWPITAWRWARSRSTTPAPPDANPPDAAQPGAQAPFALVERTTAGLILHALTPAARAKGLKLHQSHADACAIVPELVSAPAEPERAARALRRLAIWMERYSPYVTLDPGAGGMEGLFLDLTGGQHLFGGEAAMAAQILASLKRLDAPARIGVADTPGAAWALGRYGKSEIATAPQGGAREALAALPVAALRISPQAVQLLNRFGLRRVGMLDGLPRPALARRFRDPESHVGALNVLQRLDQATGALTEPLTPVTAPTVYRVQSVFAEPMTSVEPVEIQAAELAERLAASLEADHMGARRLHLTGFRVDGRTTRLEVRLASPSRCADHLLRLLRDKGFEHLELGFGIDALALSAPVAEPLYARQTTTLSDAEREHAAARDALVDRLNARLGAAAVLAPLHRESWLPEMAERLQPYAELTTPIATPDTERPILLFDPPEPIEAMAELPDGAPARFTWRRASRRVAHASGPERLAPEWWKAGGPRPAKRTRDYYRIEDEAGGRYWVFREGLYGLDPPPSWWMHGLFP